VKAGKNDRGRPHGDKTDDEKRGMGFTAPIFRRLTPKAIQEVYDRGRGQKFGPARNRGGVSFADKSVPGQKHKPRPEKKTLDARGLGVKVGNRVQYRGRWEGELGNKNPNAVGWEEGATTKTKRRFPALIPPGLGGEP